MPRQVLAANRVRVIDLFRGWDEDGNGVVSLAEFRKAIAVLGYKVRHAYAYAYMHGECRAGLQGAACVCIYICIVSAVLGYKVRHLYVYVYMCICVYVYVYAY